MSIFPQQFSVTESCRRGSLFMQFLSMTISWRHISQDRVARRLRCGGIFNYYFCCKFITESNSERILKIGLDLSKLPWVWSFGGPVLLEHSVDVYDEWTTTAEYTAEAKRGGLTGKCDYKPPRKGHSSPFLWPMSVVAKRSSISATAEHLLL